MLEDKDVLYRYKYLPFSEPSLKVISEGTLKYTCPLDFNDPFDCLPAYDPKSIGEYIRSKPRLLEKAMSQKKIKPAKKIIERQKALARTSQAVKSGEFIKGLVSELGVLSLSKIPTNILMWSHYTKDHKGFVVEFRIDLETFDDLKHDLMAPLPVEYVKDRPIINFAAELQVEDYFLKKSEDWAYEQEERVLTTHQGPGIHAYSRNDFLNCVIAGDRMKADDLERLTETVKAASKAIEKNIPLYKAKLSDKHYKVYIPGHPNPAHSQP